MENLESERAAEAFIRLVEIMRQLRAPGGCPWDREQDLASLRRYTLEEAYEVVQAIDDGDRDELRAELGDLLLQIVFVSQIAAEDGDFNVAEVAEGISDKLVRRHPHVFGDVQVNDSADVLRNWEAIKRRERSLDSVLDDVPLSLPGLERAQKFGKRAAQIGFDWPHTGQVLAKVREELEELEQAIRERRQTPGVNDAIEEELGDLLFVLTSLARHLGHSAEICVNRASAKFERRFRQLEKGVAAGNVGTTLDELEAEWQRVKASR